MATYKTFEILSIRTLRQFRKSFNTALLLNDNTTGVRRLTKRKLYPQLSWDIEVVMADRTEIQAFRDFLDAIEGKFKPFWLPNWTHDIRPILVAANNTTIKSRAYAYEGYGDDAQIPTKTKRWIATWDGTTLTPRGVTGVNRAGDQETLTITPGDGAEIDVDTYEMIMYINYVRMLQDGFDFDHNISGVAFCRFSCVALPIDFAV